MVATPQDPITTATEWKAAATQGAPLKVPSGKVCLARNPGMQAFLQAGMIPNPLLASVQEALASNKPQISLQKAVTEGDDPERMNALLELIDNAVMYCVLQPVVHTVHQDVVEPDGTRVRKFIERDQRDEGNLYIDEVDPQDKVFIFQWAVGGSSDLVKFRKELGASLADLSSGEGTPRKVAKRTLGPAATKRTNAPRPRKPAAARKR